MAVTAFKFIPITATPCLRKIPNHQKMLQESISLVGPAM